MQITVAREQRCAADGRSCGRPGVPSSLFLFVFQSILRRSRDRTDDDEAHAGACRGSLFADLSPLALLSSSAPPFSPLCAVLSRSGWPTEITDVHYTCLRPHTSRTRRRRNLDVALARVSIRPLGSFNTVASSGSVGLGSLQDAGIDVKRGSRLSGQVFRRSIAGGAARYLSLAVSSPATTACVASFDASS